MKDEPKPNPFVNPADPDNLSGIGPDPFDPASLRAEPMPGGWQTAVGRLRVEVRYLRERADRLEKLAEAVILHPDSPAEPVLWELISDALRR